jgi:hypothetical protein
MTGAKLFPFWEHRLLMLAGKKKHIYGWYAGVFARPF